jgi:hypothetical protein
LKRSLNTIGKKLCCTKLAIHSRTLSYLQPEYFQGMSMPKSPWSAKRKRQYTQIKDSLIEHGRNEPVAEEIAARIVNKERAQHGESTVASASSINDMSAGRRGGLRSHLGPGGRTLLQLRNEARQRGLKGRSKMDKAQLQLALHR